TKAGAFTQSRQLRREFAADRAIDRASQGGTSAAGGFNPSSPPAKRALQADTTIALANPRGRDPAQIIMNSTAANLSGMNCRWRGS
ncbi:hypothetical protein, partial [Streptococcus pseudopneumoniae]|uniref:hypothetical protein n=1 Tax=Streptococcus pseudopneumoniae TaxID=257758 RepID=UPI0019D56DC3